MGRPLKVVRSWTDCARCERHRHRVAVLAPEWPKNVEVVIFEPVADAASQAVLALSPQLVDTVEMMKALYSLSNEQCVGDVLVACGVGQTYAPADAAACSARFTSYPRLKVVAFASEAAFKLAQEAGLVVQGEAGTVWKPIGERAVPAVLLDDDRNLVLAALDRVLGPHAPAAPDPDRAPLATRAAQLHKLIHAATRVRLLAHDGTWRTINTASADEPLVAGHLLGRGWLSPFHPRGPWPYVVLDLDRHNSIQAVNFHTRLKDVRKLLPNSIALRSSHSGGVHIYVALPENWEYAHAALVMRAWVAIKELRLTTVRGVAAEIVEVPDQPPRLPFGLGSHLLGSTAPLEQQLDTFLAALAAPGAQTDFETAKNDVFTHFGMKTWSVSARNKLKRRLAELELEDVKVPELAADDPWRKLEPRRGVPSLSKAAWKIATAGVPAYGTRFRWTDLLLGELRELVGLEEAHALMEYWVSNRKHMSASIQTDRNRVLSAVKKRTAAIYRRVGKLPKAVRANTMNRIVKVMRTHALRGPNYVPLYRVDANETNAEINTAFNICKNLDMTVLFNTAYFIVRKFYAQRKRVRAISHREFERFAGRNAGHALRVLLERAHVLERVGSYSAGDHSRVFSLGPGLAYRERPPQRTR